MNKNTFHKGTVDKGTLGLIFGIVLILGCIGGAGQESSETPETQEAPDSQEAPEYPAPDYSAPDDSAPDDSEYTLKWSDGACEVDSDCTGMEYGCGGGHMVCTSDPEKWKEMMSTCEMVTSPVEMGYECACVQAEAKCGWVR